MQHSSPPPLLLIKSWHAARLAEDDFTIFMNNKVKITAVLSLASILAFSARATTIELNGVERVAGLGDAISGVMGDGNPSTPGINAVFSPALWTNEGNRANSDGPDGMLTVNVTNGAWGALGSISDQTQGTWSISNSFWTTYARAVIAIHLGGGDASTPEFFAWEVKKGSVAGTWYAYKKIDPSTIVLDDPETKRDESNPGRLFNGGGFSNMQLYGTGTPSVPDGGTTIILLGSVLAGLAFIRRKLA